jgi:hypothetical protein
LGTVEGRRVPPGREVRKVTVRASAAHGGNGMRPRDEMKTAANRLGFAMTPSGPDAFARLIAEQTVVYGVRIREAGLTPE